MLFFGVDRKFVYFSSLSRSLRPQCYLIGKRLRILREITAVIINRVSVRKIQTKLSPLLAEFYPLFIPPFLECCVGSHLAPFGVQGVHRRWRSSWSSPAIFEKVEYRRGPFKKPIESILLTHATTIGEGQGGKKKSRKEGLNRIQTTKHCCRK